MDVFAAARRLMTPYRDGPISSPAAATDMSVPNSRASRRLVSFDLLVSQSTSYCRLSGPAGRDHPQFVDLSNAVLAVAQTRRILALDRGRTTLILSARRPRAANPPPHRSLNRYKKILIPAHRRKMSKKPPAARFSESPEQLSGHGPPSTKVSPYSPAGKFTKSGAVLRPRPGSRRAGGGPPSPSEGSLFVADLPQRPGRREKASPHTGQC